MKTAIRRLAPLAVPLLLLSPMSHADHSSQFYVGINAGLADIDLQEYDNATAFALYGGYKFMDWVGVEVGINEIDDFEVRNGVNTVTMDVYTASLVLTGEFLYGLSVSAKLGAYDADLKASGLNTNPAVVVNDASESGLSYQVVLAKEITHNISLTGGYQYFDGVADVNIDYWNIGAQFSF